MSDLRISPDLSLPLDAVTQTFGVVAQRGAGKTYLTAVFVEELVGADLLGVGAGRPRASRRAPRRSLVPAPTWSAAAPALSRTGPAYYFQHEPASTRLDFVFRHGMVLRLVALGLLYVESDATEAAPKG